MNLTRQQLKCTLTDCENKQRVRGWCAKHWTRWKRHGDPLFTKINMGEGQTPEERFWSRVVLTANPDRCWEWQGSLFNHGYGQVSFEGKNRIAHRVAWRLFHGFYSTAECLMHVCDNPRCVNPNHLREGTVAENNRDKTLKNRQARGLDLPYCKLSDADVLKIRKDSRLHTVIAKEFNVSRGHISKIKRHTERACVKEGL